MNKPKSIETIKESREKEEGIHGGGRSSAGEARRGVSESIRLPTETNCASEVNEPGKRRVSGDEGERRAATMAANALHWRCVCGYDKRFFCLSVFQVSKAINNQINRSFRFFL